nr:MAG TPA: hypothetical protein [Bacteriophage sp.]
MAGRRRPKSVLPIGARSTYRTYLGGWLRARINPMKK